MNVYFLRFVTLVAVTSVVSISLWYISTMTMSNPMMHRHLLKDTENVQSKPVENEENSYPQHVQNEENNDPPGTEYSFDNFNNETGTSNGENIVPNIVHYLRFKQNNLTFVDAVCILSAFKNHRPDKIYFHTDTGGFVGPYWEKVKNTPGLVYEIHNVTLPDEIFGQKFSSGFHLWHAGDVTRIRILMKYGGIFLDNDIFVVRSLDSFRKYELAIGWDENQCIGTQVIVANKDARFLRLWLNSYRQYYPDQWYYNAGCKPTEEILYKRPELVHRVKLLFGVHMLVHNLYKTLWKDWRKQYSVHLLMRHRSYLDKEHLDKWPEFDENNIKNYNMTFGVMAREVYGIS